MTEISRRNQEFRNTMMSLHNQPVDSTKLRFISPEKWKKLMMRSLEVVSEFGYADKDLIHDLRVIIRSISEDKFIQAILSFQPFKPKFREVKFLDMDLNFSKMASTATNEQSLYRTPKTRLKMQDSIIEKGSSIIQRKSSVKKEPRTCQTIKQVQLQQKQSCLKEYLEVIIQEESLKKEFEKKYHPFKKILDGFVFILQNKYKNLVEEATHITLQKIQQLMTDDILVLEKLFLKISEPYQSIFTSENPDEVKSFRNKMNSFIKDYIHNNQKINTAIRKVMRLYSRKSPTILKIQKSINDFVQVDKFNIPDDFKIDGCYIQSMNSLMEFAQALQASESLKKLKQFRASIAKDVDEYYQSTGQVKERQINAEVQIEIVRFVMCKLKGWIPQIFAQLKFLEVVYGDEDIAFKYDGASYIYAQLITLFDAMQIQSSQLTKEKEKEKQCS